MLLLLVDVARHVHHTEIYKFLISLWYFKRGRRDKYDFLHEHKHCLLVIARHVQSTQNSKFFFFFWQYLKNKRGMKLIFAGRYYITLSYKLIPLIFKLPKITSLQNLCNISRKKWGMTLIFCAMNNIKVFYKLMLSFYYTIIKLILSFHFFILPGISGNLVVKSKLLSHSGSLALRQLNPIHKKGP